MKKISCFILGDEGVGKTCFIDCYTLHICSPEIPKFDNFSIHNCMYKDMPFSIEFCDPITKDNMNSLIPLHFPKTDVFIVCFSLMPLESIENVKKVWYPKIKKYSANPSIILIGCKYDLKERCLRDDYNDNDKNMNRIQPIPSSKCEEIKNEINAQNYFECSSYAQFHCQEILNSIVDIFLSKNI